MADIDWDRVEPHTRSDDLAEGLAARVADPLWLLARQWQLGEFRGEDAASPIHARVRVASAPLRSFRSDAAAEPRTEPFPTGRPLEARVEAEDVTAGPAALRLAAEAGLQLLRRLDAAGIGRLRAPLRAQFALDVDSARAIALPDRDLGRLALLARRSLDGRKVLAASAADLERAGVRAGDLATLRAVLAAWRQEVGDRFVEPGGAAGAWMDERLEHAFSVAAASDEGEVVLAAAEYPGGRLDWHAFDVDPAATHGLGRAAAATQQLELLPVPLSFAGMPASRWWELEEGTVYFGGIEAGPADLGRLVIAEFATIYSDDWFLIPVRLPAGSIARITGIDVIDTFGGVHAVRATAALDQAELAAGEARSWAFFELAGDPSAGQGKTPWLLLPPTLTGSIDGRPLEQVTFVRDEAANLAWAIEESIETPTGRALERRLQSGLAPAAAQPDADAGTGSTAGARATAAAAAWRYRLQTAVPPFWVPLVPERVIARRPDVRLRRARLLAWDELDPGVAGAQGRILAPTRALRLYEEEIPEGGVQVTRGWQLARGADGRLHLWMARRKRPGRGARGSGLRFDTIER